MFLKGVPEFNGRLLRMAEAGMGPASFLMPEDLIVATRNQAGLRARSVEWLLLGRGLNREYVDADGRVVSHVTDETTNRALWRHYRTVMTEA
jgi:fatty-acyl-CoA synthase